MNDDLESVRERLLTIAEELADLALERLHLVAAGAAEDPDAVRQIERRITRARRAVEKAASLLGDGSGADDIG